ncbi:Guanine nucleotide-binding protein subunit gamma-1 [Chamberlinius hualienensis]
MMSQIQAMKKQVVQLRQEANINRITVSQACEDLMKYCCEHQKNDVLVTGVSQSENPFKENKACTIV